MSGDITQGLDQLLNQNAEDITPYYQKTEKPADNGQVTHLEYQYQDENDREYLESLLQLILVKKIKSAIWLQI